MFLWDSHRAFQSWLLSSLRTALQHHTVDSKQASDNTGSVYAQSEAKTFQYSNGRSAEWKVESIHLNAYYITLASNTSHYNA